MHLCISLLLSFLIASAHSGVIRDDEVEAFVFQKDKIPGHCGRNAYDEKWNQLFPKFESAPEVRSKRIIGGQATQVGEWPWLVSLMFHNGSNVLHVCGATLISEQWIISAAHCFEKNEIFPTMGPYPELFTARIGEHDMTNEKVQHVDVRAKAIFIHNQRTQTTHDIALVKLAKPVRLSRNRNIACLPNPKEHFQAGKLCYAVGWGHQVEAADNISTVLKHVAVPIVPNNECNTNYGTLRTLFGPEYDVKIEDSMLCAGEDEGGKDACQFDSGGPLMCKKDGLWTLGGIISFGFGCGKAGYPGVYTRVTSFIHWINSVTDRY